MSHDDLYQKMADSVITGEAESSAALARQSLELGIPPLQSIDNGFVKGIRVVGDRFDVRQSRIRQRLRGRDRDRARHVRDAIVRDAFNGVDGLAVGRRP